MISQGWTFAEWWDMDRVSYKAKVGTQAAWTGAEVRGVEA